MKISTKKDYNDKCNNIHKIHSQAYKYLCCLCFNGKEQMGVGENEMKISELQANQLTDVQKTDFIFRNIKQDHKKGDVIFVPGSSKAVEYRLPKAVELFQAGKAKKVLFSGGVTWQGQQLTEAELLKKEAMRMGVPEEAILVENMSLHTKENVLASLLVLDREFDLHNIKRVLVVTTYIQMLRIYLSFKTYMPSWIEYSLYPVNDRTAREDNWFLTPYGRLRVETEVEKIIRYVNEGILIDEEVKISDG